MSIARTKLKLTMRIKARGKKMYEILYNLPVNYPEINPKKDWFLKYTFM